MQNKYLVRVILVALSLFTWPYSGQAAPTSFDWQARPMQSGDIANIVVSPSNPNIMYLGVEVNAHSMYKSEDNGRSWKRIDSGDHTKDVAVHPTDPNIAFYADSQSLWRTTTGGVPKLVGGHCIPTQQKCSTAFDKVIGNNYAAGPSQTSFSSIAIAPSNPEIVYVSIRGGGFGGPPGTKSAGGQLFRSTDGGANFTELSGDYPTFLVIMVDPTNPDHLLAGSEDGLSASTDGGATFTTIDSTRDIAAIDTLDGQTYLAASSGSGGGVLRSTDGGKTWEKTTTGLPSPLVFRVRFVRDDPAVAWATTHAGVARSIDSGKTWTNVTNQLPATNLKALAVDPSNPRVALVATETHTFDVQNSQFAAHGQYYHQGLYRTDDGGSTWSRSDQGLIEEKVIEITAHPTRPYEIWAGQQSSRGMYRTKDAGQTWSLSPSLLTHYPMRLAFFPGSDDEVAHTSLHTGEDFGTSTDDGITWTILSEQTFFDALSEEGKKYYDATLNQNSNLHLHGLAIDPKNPDIIYVGSVHDESPFNAKPLVGAHIFKSTDRGKTWTESDSGFEIGAKTAIHDLEIDPTAPATLYAATTRDESLIGNGIWKSSDAGLSWQRANTGLPEDVSAEVVVAHPSESRQLLAGTMQGLYRSTDGAATWKKIRGEEIWDIERDPTDPAIIYLGGTEGIWQSRDFGETWTNVSADLPAGRVRSLAVNSTGTIVYAAVDGYGLYVAIDPSLPTITPDSGVTEISENTKQMALADYGSTDHNFSYVATAAAESVAKNLALLIGGVVAGILILILVVGLLIWYRQRKVVKKPADRGENQTANHQ